MTDGGEILVAALASALILLWMAVTRPDHAACPRGWRHEGVRRDGSFSCLRPLLGDPDYDGVHGWPDRSVQPPGELWGRIYCTGGAAPIVVDQRTVGCQR